MITTMRDIDLSYLADKGDVRRLENKIQDVRTELKTEIQDVRTELKTEIQEVRTELKTEIQDLRTELKADIQDVRTEIQDVRTNAEKLEMKVDARFNVQNVMLGFISAGVGATLLTILTPVLQQLLGF